MIKNISQFKGEILLVLNLYLFWFIEFTSKGAFGVFGYVTNGLEDEIKVESGDVIESAKVTSGLDKLVNYPASWSRYSLLIFNISKNSKILIATSYVTPSFLFLGTN